MFGFIIFLNLFVLILVTILNLQFDLQSSKPVFSQSGNTSNIHNLGTQQIAMPPSPMSHVVRRSSRIITNNCSVKVILSTSNFL